MDHRLRYKRIQPVDYGLLDKVRQQTKIKTMIIEEQLSGMAANREKIRSDQLLRNYQQLWRDGARRLNEQKTKLEADLASVYNGSDMRDILHDDCHLNWMGNKQQDNFISTYILPINNLRIKVRRLMQNSSEELRKRDADILKDLFNEMSSTVKTVQKRLDQEEQNCMQFETNVEDEAGNICVRVTQNMQAKTQVPIEGIPPEAWGWKTTDDSLRADLLSDFIYLDAGFMNRVKKLTWELCEIENNCFSKWPSDEVTKCEFIWELFASTGEPRRHQNCADFLTRLGEDFTKSDYVRLLEAFAARHLLRTKIADVTASWMRARQELGDRIRVTLYDAIIEARKRDLERNNASKQRNHCHYLAELVHLWRKEKAELAELEYREGEAQRQETARLNAEKKIRDTNRRQAAKLQLEAHKRVALEQKNQLKEAEVVRLAELRVAHEAQRRRDTERLAAMERERLQKLIRTRTRNAVDLAKATAVKEARLEAIRVQVRPIVTVEPYNYLKSTEAWQHRLEQNRLLAEELDAKELLRFYVTADNPLNTFTHTQLQHDRRTRLSTALFDAGLLDSDYARKLLASIPLERPIRTDLMTTQELAEYRKMNDS